MRLLRRKRNECPVSSWAGGTTTELLLWPPEGSYPARDFLFRLSSADVEREESVFTSLPGVTRYITPLRGGFSLTFDGGAPIALAPYEIARFFGAAQTVCRGRATDFNLMLKGCEGSLTALRGGAEIAVPGGGAGCLFFPEGGEFALNGSCRTADTGELVACFAEEGERCALRIEAPVTLFAEIRQIHA